MYEIEFIFINGVIQGQDFSDYGVFRSVVMSNVCDCIMGL